MGGDPGHRPSPALACKPLFWQDARWNTGPRMKRLPFNPRQPILQLEGGVGLERDHWPMAATPGSPDWTTAPHGASTGLSPASGKVAGWPADIKSHGAVQQPWVKQWISFFSAGEPWSKIPSGSDETQCSCLKPPASATRDKKNETNLAPD